MRIPFSLFSLGRIEEAYRHVLIDVRLLNYVLVLSCFLATVRTLTSYADIQMPIRNIPPSNTIEIMICYLDDVSEFDVSEWHFAGKNKSIPSLVMIASLMQPPEEASRSIATAIQFLTNLGNDSFRVSHKL